MGYLRRVTGSVLTEVIVVFFVASCFHAFLNEIALGKFDADSVGAVFSDCLNPCEVLYSPGGSLQRFQRAARELNEGAHGRTLVIINGSCISGCSVFADLAREHICITKNAIMGFHKGYRWDWHFSLFPLKAQIDMTRFDQPQTFDIDRWVRSHGDYPKDDVTYMGVEVAKKFWPVCDLNPPLPRPDPRKRTAALTRGGFSFYCAVVSFL